MQTETHPLTPQEMGQLVAQIARVPLDQVNNFVCVARVNDEELRIISADPHSSCVAKLLMAAMLTMAEEDDSEGTAVNTLGESMGFIPDGKE